MNLSSLHNPRGITAITLWDGKTQVLATDICNPDKPTTQGFQEYPMSVELWQMFDGKLVRVERFSKRRILALWKDENTRIEIFPKPEKR